MAGLSTRDYKRAVEVRREIQKVNRQDKKELKALAEENMGYYKTLVLECYISVFVDHYGVDIDLNSIVDSIEFITDSKTMEPSFVFHEERIKFKPDFEYNIRKFNYNVLPDFTQTNILLDFDLLLFNSFETLELVIGNEEFELNKDSTISTLSLDESYNLNPGGIFIPLDNEGRYGKLNQINRLGGYASISDVSEEATNLINKRWIT